MDVSQPTQKFEPKEYQRAALGLIRTHPFSIIGKVAADIFGMMFSAMFSVSLILLLTTGLGASLRLYGDRFMGPFMSWLSNPLVVVGVLGLAFTTWTVNFAVQSLAWTVVWSHTSEAMQTTEPVPVNTMRRIGLDWGKALRQRLFIALVEMFLIAFTVTVVLTLIALGKSVGAYSDSIWAPAFVWGFGLATMFLYSGALRFVSEAVAAEWFLVPDESFGSALLRAFRLIIQKPVEIYRLFMAASIVLIPALFLFWGAIVFQNLTLNDPALSLVGMGVRSAGEVILLVGMGAFVLVFQLMLFFYVANRRGNQASKTRLEMTRRGKKTMPPSLAEMLPVENVNIMDVGDVLGDFSGDDVTFTPTKAPDIPLEVEPKPYSLDAILRSDAQSLQKDEEE